MYPSLSKGYHHPVGTVYRKIDSLSIERRKINSLSIDRRKIMIAYKIESV